MNRDAFRCMHRGLQQSTLNKQDLELLKPIEQKSDKTQRALYLIHGFSSTPAVFRLLIPALAQYYDGLYCPVLPGHSDTISAFAKVKAHAWLLQVEETYERLAQVYERVEVLGLSLGGLLACHLSKRYSLAHLYLLAPALSLLLPLDNTIKLVKILLWFGFRMIRAAAGNVHSTQHCEIAYRQLPLTSILEVLTLIQQFQFSAPTCPTDLFLGCFDEVVSSWQLAEKFAEKPNINIHWLPNSAHVLPLDGDIDTILDCIKQNKELSGTPIMESL